MESRPNIVVIMADDLGFGDLGFCNGGSTLTPAIDSLARDGTFLIQHYSASPICAPARAAFLTGRYPQRSGVIDTFPHRASDRISLRERTLADLLTEAGYHTGLIGKWHSGALGDAYHPCRRGFSEFVGFRGGVQDYWDWRLERHGEAWPSDGRYLTDVFTDEAVQFIRRHSDERFFLKLSYTAPHGPFQAPPRPAGDPSPPPSTVGETIAAMVERMDVGIAAVLAELERCGLTDDTLVLFTSDNGPWMRPGPLEETTVRFNIGLAGGKELVLEGGIRVPTIVRWPNQVPSGTTLTAVSHFVDWVPTLLAIAGHPDAARLPGDGLDISNQLLATPSSDATEAVEEAEARTLFWQWSRYAPTPRANAAIRVGDWKMHIPAVPGVLMILPQDPAEERLLRADPSNYRPPAVFETPLHTFEPKPPQLFDLANDAGESTDRSMLDPLRVERMLARFDAWYAEVEFERRSLTD
ncbi:MAG: sulfatase-like hydrolase/transferase [Ilumatobacteraceae bacterium]